MNPSRHLGRSSWVGGSAHHKASTYLGQHNTKSLTYVHALKPRIPVLKHSKTTCTLRLH